MIKSCVPMGYRPIMGGGTLCRACDIIRSDHEELNAGEVARTVASYLKYQGKSA
jgi:hypothetical protein